MGYNIKTILDVNCEFNEVDESKEEKSQETED